MHPYVDNQTLTALLPDEKIETEPVPYNTFWLFDIIVSATEKSSHSTLAFKRQATTAVGRQRR